MADGQQLESGSPAGEAFYQLFEELNAQVDAAGNRSLAKVLQQHPFPIYEATVRRHHMLKEHPTDVEEFAVKVGGAVGEVLVAGFDLVWDVATAPAHLTLFPEIRHPLYKATLAKLADYGKRENMRYTTPMAATPRTEGEHPPIADSLVPGADAMSPPPPEGLPPISAEPLRPEHQEHSPQREAFHQLMRDILEVSAPALREDVRDRAQTNGALTLTAAEAWHEATKNPWNLPKHLRNFDTALRGRDLGSLKLRFARDAVNNLIALGAASVDLIDAPADAGALTPATGMGRSSMGVFDRFSNKLRNQFCGTHGNR